jgi:type II secretory pathway pseudopilin PulG
MKTTPSSFSRKKGITLIDVLVVITVLVIIASLLLPALSKAKISSGPVCLSNANQQALALFIYAGDHNDSLPVNSPQARYCWDMEASVADELTNNGVVAQNFYEPRRSSGQSDPPFGPMDWFGEGPNNFVPGGTPSLWTLGAPLHPTNTAFGQSGFRRTGYAQTIYGTADYGFDDKLQATSPTATNANQKLTSTNDPSKRVLLACATLTSSPGTSAPSDNYEIFNTYNWANSPMGYKFKGKPKPFISAHLKDGKPLGGNEAMLDGHVEWRPFSNMVHRTIGDVIFYY